jgi:hypothetical protein
MMTYHRIANSDELLVRLPSTLVAGRIGVWASGPYFVPNDGRVFDVAELEEITAKLKSMAPDSTKEGKA